MIDNSHESKIEMFYKFQSLKVQLEKFLEALETRQKRWLNTTEAAQYIGYERRVIYQLVKYGKLPVVRLIYGQKFGGYRFDRQDLDRLMLNHKANFPEALKNIKNNLAG